MIVHLIYLRNFFVSRQGFLGSWKYFLQPRIHKNPQQVLYLVFNSLICRICQLLSGFCLATPLKKILFGFDGIIKYIFNGFLFIVTEHIPFLSIPCKLCCSVSSIIWNFFSYFLLAPLIGFIEIVKLFADIWVQICIENRFKISWHQMYCSFLFDDLLCRFQKFLTLIIEYL